MVDTLLGRRNNNTLSYIISHSKGPRIEPCDPLQVVGNIFNPSSELQYSFQSRRNSTQCVRYMYIRDCSLTSSSMMFFHFAQLNALFTSSVTTAQHLPSCLIVSTVDFALRNPNCLSGMPPSISAIGSDYQIFWLSNSALFCFLSLYYSYAKFGRS